MPIITKDGNEFSVYADVDEATAYSYGSMDAAAWIAASQDTKERTLITATRILDRQVWRTDLDPPVSTFEERVEIDNIVNAAIELAFGIAAGSDVETNNDQSTKEIKSLRAGSVSIEYNTGASQLLFESKSRWPLPVQEKLRGYLGGDPSSIGGAISSGTDGCSATNNDFSLNRGL